MTQGELDVEEGGYDVEVAGGAMKGNLRQVSQLPSLQAEVVAQSPTLVVGV
jgi:hypothetical protein